jgi:transcriptional antiterminator NusG
MSEEHTKKGQETEEKAVEAEEAKTEESVEESAPEETAVEEAAEESAPEESAGEQAPEESAEEAVPEEPAADDGEAEVDGESPKEAESAEESAGEESESAGHAAEESVTEKAGAVAIAGELTAAEAEEEKSRRMRWYVVHTYSGRENKVKDTIERMIRNSEMQDQFGKVLVATEEVAEMKKGKKKVSQRKLFPSYILIEMEMSDEAWGMIENVPGVTHFVGEGKKPFPIPKKEVDRILGRMVKKEGVVPEVPYTIGEHVKVVDGPFTDFSGIVDEINPERGKLKVLVSIFGRETPVELDFLQVKSL